MVPSSITSAPEGSTTHLHGIQELQKTLTSTFNKTVQEWEKIKGRRSRESGSPVHDRKVSPDTRSRKEERSKSRDRGRDRSRQKYEREMQKIEKQEQKLEKERQKLEKLKLKLDASYESSSSSDQGPGVTQDFMKKLQEWETIKGGSFKGLSLDSGMSSENVPLRSKSEKLSRDVSPCIQRERVLSDSSLMGFHLCLPARNSSSPTPTSPESPLPTEGHPHHQEQRQGEASLRATTSSLHRHSHTETSLAHTFGQRLLDENLTSDLTLTLEDFFR